jgi:uncharacterized Tic20 family protein
MNGAQPQIVSKRERGWAALCHGAAIAGFIIPFVGNILGPMLIWMLKKDAFPLVDDQGKESMNFQIMMSILYVASALLLFLVLGLLLLVGLGMYSLIMIAIATVRTMRGEIYRYPISVRLIK